MVFDMTYPLGLFSQVFFPYFPIYTPFPLPPLKKTSHSIKDILGLPEDIDYLERPAEDDPSRSSQTYRIEQPKKKKARTTFSGRQIFELEKQYGKFSSHL
uniref:Homeobox domain-containing protein n=1 Tax=Heterorhabditis bacteriophora TaxID=37862 RepID=A0A1I7XEB8_HETBA